MPTVILAKTVKGYGMGHAGEAQNITHQQKKLDDDRDEAFRDRFNIPVADDDLPSVPYYQPAADSRRCATCCERRAALGGALPQRRRKSESLPAPPLALPSRPQLQAGEREISTTMAFVRG
jgi:pyruvate dehydrogenase E1 component